MMELTTPALRPSIETFFAEDDLSRNLTYMANLPSDPVDCELFIKSDCVLSGAPWFVESFRFLGAESYKPEELLSHEGRELSKGTRLSLGQLPFGLALTGERIALNLLQRASSISTFTHQFSEKAKSFGVKILDTRKTTPGLRALEKYAVVKGGGTNHRLGQTDMWMVKDNHKTLFGGVKEAVQFFRDQQGMYTPILVELHDQKEIDDVVAMGVRHLMLDNFTPDQVKEAIAQKQKGITYEVSGGITLENFDSYLMEGLDAISIGSLTYAAPAVDISFKYKRSQA